ncbi:hypothetical protein FA15DRAFT_661399 [Coprinopsis marcescibilis]|uniref:Uncharacterized protein n=1 Tax=Coprinopsis marcescibilis TaxID=230819 RepID=A0A5C3KCM0_COPMA|nr:hypothetical protein FA15DRAFT_661399 [Coprinopsis marcescibilis]
MPDSNELKATSWETGPMHIARDHFKSFPERIVIAKVPTLEHPEECPSFVVIYLSLYPSHEFLSPHLYLYHLHVPSPFLYPEAQRPEPVQYPPFVNPGAQHPEPVQHPPFANSIINSNDFMVSSLSKPGFNSSVTVAVSSRPRARVFCSEASGPSCCSSRASLAGWHHQQLSLCLLVSMDDKWGEWAEIGEESTPSG